VSGLTLPASATDLTPVDVPGNPSCADLGFLYGVKIDDIQGLPVVGTYPVSEAESGIVGGGTVTISNVVLADGVVFFDWSSTIPWAAVVVKQGNAAAVYYYVPASTGDTGLHPSLTDGEPDGSISHIDLCRDDGTTSSSSSSSSSSSTSSSTSTTEATTSTTQATTSTTEGTTSSVEGTSTSRETETTEQGTTSVLGAVIERPAPTALPRTGTSTAVLTLLGTGLVLLGAGALRLAPTS
jgi:hypothetical protein